MWDLREIFTAPRIVWRFTSTTTSQQGDTMANCHNLFRIFDDKISLSNAVKSGLRTSRDSLREKVRDKFREKDHKVLFYTQGSLPMGTIIAPSDNDYDIDDGIYLQDDDLPSEAITTLHTWVSEAAQNHTNQKPTDKNTCVRVHFADDHHIDLVLYYLGDRDHPLLAHKRDDWIVSDPKEFMEWFRSQSTPQLKSLVRYLKAWGDNLRGDMPSGLIMTVLAAQNFSPDDRDDIACMQTLTNILTTLQATFVCFRPTTPREDLFSEYSDSRKEYFMERLSTFVNSAQQAIQVPNQKDACPKWRQHFGRRFPCEVAEDTLEDAKTFEAAAIIRGDSRSA
jgi:hypothetical protein